MKPPQGDLERSQMLGGLCACSRFSPTLLAEIKRRQAKQHGARTTRGDMRGPSHPSFSAIGAHHECSASGAAEAKLRSFCSVGMS